MQRLRPAAAALIALGLAVLAVPAVRGGLFWIVDPLNDALVLAAAAAITAGLVVLVRSTRAVAGRPARTTLTLAVGGLLLAGARRLIEIVPAGDPDGAGFVRYGPGTPPSISWPLLESQVLTPVLGFVACGLLLAGAAGLVLAAARGVSTRLRPA